VPEVRIQTGATEPIEVLIVDAFRVPIVGLTNVKAKIRRLSDNLLFDWSDNAFKAVPTALLQTLVTINAASFPGEYRLDSSPHVKGFNTSAIVNPVTDDVYRVTVVQDGTPQSAANVPQIGEIKEGDFIDLIDQAISDNATPAEVKAELVALGLDHLISVNPGIVPPAAGTYIRQILDRLNAQATHSLEMSFSYDPAADKLTANVWLESANLTVGSPGSLSLTLYDEDGTAQLGPLAAAGADAQGVFKVEVTPTGLVKNRAYYAEATVTLPAAAGTVEGVKGMFTIGTA
jgi:hypothetical protein